MNSKHRIVLLLLLEMLFRSPHLQSAVVLHGDSENPDQSFSFPIRSFVANHDGSTAFVGASVVGGKNFALTKFINNGVDGIAVAPENVLLNLTMQHNPLYDAAINHLVFTDQPSRYGTDDLLGNGNRLIAVPHQLPNTVFVMDEIKNPADIVMFGFSTFDGSGTLQASDILSLAIENRLFIFAAVTNNVGGTFGDTNSGIALLLRTNVPKPDSTNNEMIPFFSQLDAEPGVPPVPTALRAAALNGDIPAVFINSPATLLDNIVDLHYNNALQKLYIALKVQSGSQPNDGVRAIVTATIQMQETTDPYQQAKIIFKEIAPDAVFVDGQNTIVGRRTGTEPNPLISCYKVRTMVTSTNLLYLVVFGGYGDAPATKQTIYTLPLVFMPSEAINGMLAAKNAIPVDHFETAAPYRFGYRAFETPALVPGDLFTADDPAVNVGGGQLAAGEIDSFFINNDAIYATVANPAPGYLPGIFYSRALFDKYGRVKGWTQWQRVFGMVNDLIFGGYIFQTDGSCTFLTGSSESQIFTLKRTVWQYEGATTGMKNFGKFLSTTFSPQQGGARGIYETATDTEGLDGISLIVATGVNTIMISQTAYTNAGVLTPLVGDSLAQEPLIFSNGTITTNFPSGNTNAIMIKDGVLSNVGPLVTAVIGTNNTHGFLFAGGVGGVAVLIDEQGNGWPNPPGLGDKFSGLQSGMSFKNIGNYRFVRKLLVDNGYLYVLCDDRLDRITLATSNFATNDLSVTTLAQAADVGVVGLLDCIVSNELALLGTTNGFYRSMNGNDIRTDNRIAWQNIDLPEGLSAVLQLAAITQNNGMGDLTNGAGGNVYLLSTDRGKNRANLFRFTVKPTAHGIEINELPDLYVKNQPSYFIEFTDFRNWAFPDGGYLFHGRDRENRTMAMLDLIASPLRSGLRFAGNLNTVLFSSKTAEHLVPLIRNNASGSLLVPTNDGLVCNE